SADATCARNIATKVTAVRNTVGRCLRMNALLWLVRDGSLSRKGARGRARKLRAMGASHPNADTRQRYYNGAKGHKRTRAVQQLGSLFDHLVSERQKIYRQLDARGLCGLEVNDELVVCRFLERQISRPRATQDACGETGRALHAFFQVGSIGHQAAV